MEEELRATCPYCPRCQALQTPQPDTRTDEEKHRARCCPGWEYETVIEGRKAGDGHAPDGEGWEPNNCVNHMGGRWGSFERFDFTEETYWKRRT